MPAPLSVDDLYQLTDDNVKDIVKSVFLNQIQYSSSVYSTFFSSVGAPAVNPVNPGWTDSIAVALVGSAISHSSLYGFSKTVNQQACDSYWQSQLSADNQDAVNEGHAIYDWAFPVYCKSVDHTFNEYLTNNPGGWAQQLAEKVTSDSFVNIEVSKIIAQDPDWPSKLNLVLYKLSRLDGNQVQKVKDTWAAKFSDMVPSALSQTFNYLPNNMFQSDQFLSQANAAISVGKDDHWCTVCPGTLDPICDYWTDYGLAVVDFLGGKPKSLGFSTGQSPDNHVTHGGGGGCFVEGTTIHLSNGTQFAIEDVGEGHEVLARDGQVSRHSDEKVVIHLETETAVYGINEDEPFFSSGHPFMTKDGWKAMEPSIALEENPNRKVKKLCAGDVVYKISNVSPLTYEEVRIEKFTAKILEPGSKLFGIHALGSRSYHANGYLVAMNYPVITEKRITEGFKKLSEKERLLVLEALTPVMPLLKKAIGSFIEVPLKRSLSKHE